MSWTTVYDGVFFISLSTIVVGAFGLSLKYCLKSKCESFSLCFGLINLKRNVELEVEEHKTDLENGITDDENQQQKRRESHTSI